MRIGHQTLNKTCWCNIRKASNSFDVNAVIEYSKMSMVNTKAALQYNIFIQIPKQ